MLAGAQRRHRHVFVKEGGQAEIHGIDVGIAQDGVDVAILFDGGEIEEFARASQIALRAGQVAGELPLVVGKDRRQCGARHLAPGAQVNAAHET